MGRNAFAGTAAGGIRDSALGSSAHTVLLGFINGHYHSEATLDRILFETGIDRYSTAWHLQSAMPIDEQALYDAVLTGLIRVRARRPDEHRRHVLRQSGPAGLRGGCGAAGLSRPRRARRVRPLQRDQNIYVHAPDESFLCRLSREIADEVRRSSIGYAWPTTDVLNAYRRLVERWDDPAGRIRVIPAPDWTPS